MSVNKVILIGNVGKEPEIRHLDNNNVVASFPLATTERGYKTASGVQVPDRTEWHNIIAWRGLAEIIEKYVHKGTQLYVEGKIRTRSWEDQNNNRRYVTEIYADNISLLSKKTDTQPVAQQENNSTNSFQATQQQQDTFSADSQNNGEDDLPF